jgi:N-acetylglucosaminyl-diphospho-decaprenol L-rhamnosyltransferase
VRGPFQGGPDPARVAVVIVSFNTREELRRCLRSLVDQATLPLQVIVVDNASGDQSPETVRRDFATVLLLENDENLGFARAANRGLREARAPYVLFLNSDAEVRPGALETLVALLDARPEVGVVGPRTRGTDGTIQVSSGPALTPLSEWRQRRLVRGVRGRVPAALARAERIHAEEHEPPWVSAACLLARREALLAVGGFDEAFFLYEEDVDLCVRVRRAGWRILFTPRADVLHHLGRSMEKAGTRGDLEYHRSHILYYRKHNGRLSLALLRAHVSLLALSRWVAALGRGPERQGLRRDAGRLLRAAWKA